MIYFLRPCTTLAIWTSLDHNQFLELDALVQKRNHQNSMDRGILGYDSSALADRHISYWVGDTHTFSYLAIFGPVVSM